MSLLSLNCLVFGNSLDEMFTIEIPRTENVSILKDIIREKSISSFRTFPARKLDLWKVCLPLDNLETIQGMDLENNHHL